MIADSIPPATKPKVLTTPLGSAYPVLSTAIVIAFLDIAPVTPGHILLCPRRHCVKATDMTVAVAAALGVWLPILTRALPTYEVAASSRSLIPILEDYQNWR
jgi:diadenosine tetraphosphate (Ap4A) HIT family hydrolase